MNQQFQQYFNQIESNYAIIAEVSKKLNESHPTEEGLFSTIGEKLGNFIRAIDELIHKGITGIVNIFRNTTVVLEDAHTTYKTVSPYIKRLNKYREKLNDKLKKLTTPELADIAVKKVPVPMGLKIDILTYINKLEAVKNAVLEIDSLQDQLEKRLDEMLNNPIEDFPKYLPASYELKAMSKTVMKYENTFKDMYGKRMTDTRTIGSLVKKIPLVPGMVNDILTLGKIYNMEKLEDIDKRNEELVAKAKKLLDIVKKEDEALLQQYLGVLGDYFKLYAEYITVVGISNIAYSQLADIMYNIVKVIVDGKIAGKAHTAI